MTSFSETLRNAYQRLLRSMNDTYRECLDDIECGYQIIEGALQSSNKIIACGNGGSAATAQHFTAELIGRYKKERPALPALSLTVDTSALTAIANDYSYEDVFIRQLSGLSNAGDVIVGFSTSGRSPNVLRALQYGFEHDLKTVLVTGDMRKTDMLSNLSAHIMVPTNETARIQEVHDFIIHVWCETLDSTF